MYNYHVLFFIDGTCIMLNSINVLTSAQCFYYFPIRHENLPLENVEYTNLDSFIKTHQTG